MTEHAATDYGELPKTPNRIDLRQCAILKSARRLMSRMKGEPHVSCVVIAYPSEEKAEEVRQQLLRLQAEYLIELEDAVIAVKTSDGYVRLNQLISPTSIGAASDVWGLLIGAILPELLRWLRRQERQALSWPRSLVRLSAAPQGAIGGALTDLGLDDSLH